MVTTRARSQRDASHCGHRRDRTEDLEAFLDDVEILKLEVHLCDAISLFISDSAHFDYN